MDFAYYLLCLIIQSNGENIKGIRNLGRTHTNGRREVNKIKYWFTGDMHFGHFNIIRYTGRPFKSLEHMNKTLIRNWNKRVEPDDLVIHNGDFCFRNSKGGKKGEGITMKARDWERELNGKIIYIIGSHDKNNSVRSIIHKLVIKYGHHYINIVHDPRDYDINFKVNFTAHVHEKWKFKRTFSPMDERYIDLINIGTDVWNFQPVTFEEIYRDYKRWSKRTSTKWKDDESFVRKLRGMI